MSYSGVLASQNIDYGQGETIFCAFKNGSIGIFDYLTSKVIHLNFNFITQYTKSSFL